MDTNMSAKKALEFFELMQEEVDNREDFKEGLSFLDLKNDTLLSYMIDLCNVILRKVNCEPISDHQSVDRCVEYRVILEKIKGLDTKLAYQLNKLIASPDDVDDTKIDLDIDLDTEDNTQAPNAKGSSLDDADDSGDDDEDEEEDDDDDDDEDDENSEISLDEEKDNEFVQERSKADLKKKPEKSSASGIYKPPKLRSVAYLGRKRDFHEFYQDNDDVVEERVRDRDEEERIKFEENNYSRLPEKNKKRDNRQKFKKDNKKKKRRK